MKTKFEAVQRLIRQLEAVVADQGVQEEGA
jgi:hypothetical protein